MRTFVPMFGGMMLGSGLHRIWISDYKKASFYLVVSALIYFIGYINERYRTEDYDN